MDELSHCKWKITKGIMRFEWCKRPAVRDGYCTRHHPSYLTPSECAEIARRGLEPAVAQAKAINHARKWR